MISPKIYFDQSNNKLVYSNAHKVDINVLEEYKDTEILDLSYGLFEDLPKELSKLKNLKVLFLSYGKIKKIPEVVRDLEGLVFLGARSCGIETLPEECLPRNLKWLTLTDNNINNLPKSIGKLEKLKKLLLTRNKIDKFPKEIINCQSLELLRISLNSLTESPLSMLADLPKLAWYSDSDNLFNIDRKENNLKRYDVDELNIVSTIVDSPNSKVERVSFNNINVILKLFKNEFVSDGSATNEIMINSRLGIHPNIMRPYGYIGDKTKNLKGLLIEDLSEGFKPIAASPDFNSCTRDVYKNFVISKEAVKKVTRSLKDACDYLHGLGVMHGDIYGHNTYLNLQNSEVKIGDFGAASVIPNNEVEMRRKIDIRALNILIDEINACVLSE